MQNVTRWPERQDFWAEGKRGEHLRNQPVFFHIDSEAAKHSLIRGTCQQREAQFLVSAILHLETQLCLRPWYSRIPSESNPADAPSRLEFSGLTQQGFDHQAVSNDSVLALVQAARGRSPRIKKEGFEAFSHLSQWV